MIILYLFGARSLVEMSVLARTGDQRKHILEQLGYALWG